MALLCGHTGPRYALHQPSVVCLLCAHY